MNKYNTATQKKLFCLTYINNMRKGKLTSWLECVFKLKTFKFYEFQSLAHFIPQAYQCVKKT